MAMKLVGIGGLGLMLSPSAKHLKPGGPAVFSRIHDRGTRDSRRDECRRSWKEHGAQIVNDFEPLIGEGDFDGVVICAGKNGDDLKIIKAITPILKQKHPAKPFILHLSTVSASFVAAAHDFLSSQDIEYANYPLTGGPAGADTATMLILASGPSRLYDRLEPTLQTIGNPKFFGESLTAGSEVKLIGQLMVFNGLFGISSAGALRAECFADDLTGAEQASFFDFLNNGAGGTRQWDVALSKGVRDNVWDQGFMIHHAVVDAIYAAELCLSRGLPAIAIMPILATAVAFTFLLRKYEGTPLATHAIIREMLKDQAAELDSFANECIRFGDVVTTLKNCIDALPENVKSTVYLDIQASSFGI